MKKYAVMGDPVEHSLSPTIHQSFSDQTGCALLYTKINVSSGELDKAIASFRAAGGRGCNITLPLKEEAYLLADKKTDDSQQAQAANCLQFNDDGSISAANFDGIGLVQDITQNLKHDLSEKRLLIVGAGGAARGIIGPLLNENPFSILVANRTPEKARQLAALFSAQGNVCGVDLNDVPSSAFDIVIHTTSMGHNGEYPNLSPLIIDSTTLCYDISYGITAHPFLQWAKKVGCMQCSDGLGMLVEQAAASFNYWQGISPQTAVVIEALRVQD